jgi:pSer/pThr/pTyr-binding forkhead associated (FHA) protein
LALRCDGLLVISDLDSANGTFVNGRVVNTGEAQKLEFGDDIQIGDLALKISRLEA